MAMDSNEQSSFMLHNIRPSQTVQKYMDELSSTHV